MIELQVLNKILKDKSLSIVTENGLDDSYFPTFVEEYKYIQNHYNKYGAVPDRETFGTKFPEFDFLNVGENEQYLIDTLREEHAFTKLVPIVQKTADILQQDANKAINYLHKEIEPLMRESITIGGKDIVKDSMERWDEYIRRKNLDGLLGITTGLKELDELLHGWLPGEELVSIVGRPNEGKSWILLFFLMQAWKAGKRVLLYSGEMSTIISGYRFDTLNSHFSNRGLMSGSSELGTDNIGGSEEDYKAYLESLANNDNPFIIVTPKMLGNKRPTVQTINMLIEKYQPDIVGLDQLSLMADYRKGKGDPVRIQYSHIVEDLYLSSEKYKIPFLLDVQGSRKSVQKKKSDDAIDKAPELDEIAESDGIGQNSSRVISIKQTSAGLILSVKKNRYGENNKDFLYFWDINYGMFKFIPQYHGDGEIEETTEETSQAEDIF